MSLEAEVKELGKLLAADFSNQEQAFKNPPLFAHVRVCMRPLPYKILPGLSLFLEQAYDYILEQPYRIRVLDLVPKEDKIEIETYFPNDSEFYRGASRDPERLKEMTVEDLTYNSGCNMEVERDGKGFRGRIEPKQACIVPFKQKDTYLDSYLWVDSEQFITLDRGRDPETGKRIWGSIAGEFRFKRWNDFSAEIEGESEDKEESDVATAQLKSGEVVKLPRDAMSTFISRNRDLVVSSDLDEYLFL